MTVRVDIEAIGAFLRDHGGYGGVSNDPTVSYLKLRETGPVLALLHVDDADADLDPGQVGVVPHGPQQTSWAPISARWVEASKGRRSACRLNEQHRHSFDGGIPGHAEPAIHAEELGILFTRFPHDRRLTSLPTVSDGRSMADLLQPILEPHAAGVTIAAVDVVPVRYKPEGQCVLRYEIEWAGLDPPPPLSFYGKITKRSAFERSLSMQATVAAIGVTTGFAVPRSIGTLHDLSLELSSIVPGVHLSEVIGTGIGKGLGANVGRALRTLHDAPISLSRTITVDDRIELVVDNAHQLVLFAPEQAPRVPGLASAIVERLASLRSSRLTPTHHDFHGRNVLVDGASLGLLDFDDLAVGDPADDVGSMYAHLVELAVLNPRRSAAIEAERSAFLGAYLGDHGSAIVGEDRCVAHAAAHCLLAAYQTLRHPGPPAHRRIRAMLDEAEALLSRGLT